MPVHPCTEGGKPGWQWGNQKCYTYTAGNEASETEAKQKAILQGVAIGEKSMATEHMRAAANHDAAEAHEIAARQHRLAARAHQIGEHGTAESHESLAQTTAEDAAMKTRAACAMK